MSATPRTRHASGGRRRSLAQIDKDNQALALYCQGKQYPEIAAALGWRSRSSACEAVQRALADRQMSALEGTAGYALAEDRIHRLLDETRKDMERDYYAVTTTGVIVTDPVTGEKVIDPAPRQRAIDQQIKLIAELNKLQGNYAPAKSRVEVVTAEQVEAESKRIVAKLVSEGELTEQEAAALYALPADPSAA